MAVLKAFFALTFPDGYGRDTAGVGGEALALFWRPRERSEFEQLRRPIRPNIIWFLF